MNCETQYGAQINCNVTLLISRWLTDVKISLHVLLSTLGNYLNIMENDIMNKDHLRSLLNSLS